MAEGGISVDSTDILLEKEGNIGCSTTGNSRNVGTVNGLGDLAGQDVREALVEDESIELPSVIG